LLPITAARPEAAMSLGEILVRQGLLSRAQLESALAGMHDEAGGLATRLVHQNLVTYDELALALAEEFGVPPALEADFARSDPLLRQRMVVHQAIELQAIPLFLTGQRRVAVAMANPVNRRALDRVAFALGATVDPMVTSEVALLRQFELLYNVRRRNNADAVRKTASSLPIPQQIADGSATPEPGDIRPALRSHRQMARARRTPQAKQAAYAAPTAQAKPADPPLQLAPLEIDEANREPGAPVAVMEDALCFTATPLGFLPPTPVAEPPVPSRVLSRHPLTPLVVPLNSAGVQLAVEQIRFATDQQDLSDSLFTFMRACFAVGAMFAVSGADAQGRFGFSGGMVRPAVEHLRFPLSLPSCLRIARSRRATYRGIPPPDGLAVQGPLWAALHTEPPSDVLVSPVIVDGLVTLLLYAQGEPGKRVNGLAAAKMEQVCDVLGSSLLRLAV
jgi:hypothetical protein